MLQIVKKHAVALTLLGFFVLYHSNLRDQGVPSESLDLKLVNFALADGKGLDIAPALRESMKSLGSPEAYLSLMIPASGPARPNKPIFAALPFLPIYAWYRLFEYPETLYAVDFLGKFCAVFYGIFTLWAFYGIARNLGASERIAWLSMIGFGASTHVWHAVSQMLATNASFVPYFAGGLYFATRRKPTGADAWLAGLCWGYAVAVRPQDTTVLAPFAAWFLWHNSKHVIRLLTPLAALGIATFAMNLILYGSLLGTYAANGTSTLVQLKLTNIQPGFTGSWLTGVPGLLISPSRGLLVFWPLLVFTVFQLRRHWKKLRDYRAFTLLHASLAACAVQLLFYGKFNLWHGGWAWGPRLLVSALPAFFVLFVVTLPKKFTRAQVAALALLFSWGVLVQGLGAYKYWRYTWNWDPVEIDFAPERAWSLRDPQILRAWNDPWYKPKPDTYSLEY